MNLSKFFFLKFILLNCLCVSQLAFAKAKAKAPAPVVGKARGVASAPTGADLMQSKDSTALPTFVDNLAADRNKKSDKINLDQVKPPKRQEVFQKDTGDRAELERITDTQISELYNLTTKFKNSPNRGELWLRLAELYVDKANQLNLKKQEQFDRDLQLFNEGKIAKRPQFESQDAKEYNRKAVQLYEWFQRDFPKNEKMDQVLFFLGFNYFELNESEKAVHYYKRLVTEFPRSPLLIESYFSLGEYYFENERWSDANQNYSAVMNDRNHRLFGFALYKSAWCMYKTGNEEKGLKALEILIRYYQSNTTPSTGGKSKLDKHKLQGEALRDLVIFYGGIGSADGAFEYFKSLAGENYLDYVEKLAYYYMDKGEKEKAIKMFKTLIQMNPTGVKAFEFNYQIVLSYSNSKDSDVFRKELYIWIRDYDQSSAWYKANIENKAFIENSYKMRELTLRNFILQIHQTAQNSRAAFSQKLAYDGYKIYLNDFANSPNYSDMRFYNAELLYDMKLYSEAAESYKWVVVNTPQSKFAPKAYLNTVLSAEKMIPSETEITKRIGSNTNMVPFDPLVDQFVKTAQWYLSKATESEQNVEIKFKIGRLHYLYNQFDLAIAVFKEIVQKNPTSKYAEYSANLILDIFSLKKDYNAIEKNGAELLSLPSFANSKAGSDIKGVMEKAGFKKAQELEISKDYAKSASQYESFASLNPTSPLASTALFNAAINYERANMIQKAMSTHKVFLESKDKENEANRKKSMKIIAKLYQDTFQFEEAAKAYEIAAINSTGEKTQGSLYYNAAVLYEALTFLDRAIKNYDQYLKTATPDEVEETQFKLATSLRQAEKWVEAVAKYKEFLRVSKKPSEKIVEANYWIYQASIKLGQKNESENLRLKTLAKFKEIGKGSVYAAKLRFLDAERKYDNLKTIVIPADMNQQQAAAKKKIGTMAELNALLVEVIKFDSPDEIVSALSLLGLANLHMSDSLINAPAPTGLSPDEVKQYKEGVAKIAEPYLKKSLDSFKASAEKGRTFEVYNDYYVYAIKNLARQDSKLAYDGGELPLENKSFDWMGLQ